MNGFFLLIPFMLIRYGLLFMLNKEAFKNAAFFPPLIGYEKIAFWLYQLSSVLMVVCLFFQNVKPGSAWFTAGLWVYGMGAFACAASVTHYAKPAANGMNLTGPYRVSRNPMYVAYFLVFLGCGLLTRSPLLFGLLTVLQVSTHWIILSEERWCEQKFGKAYIDYKESVRRYI